MARDPKEMVAVRLDPADRKRLKVVAERLEVNDSDLLRYAVKLMLADFAPLTDQALEGAEVLGAFIEHGPEKARWLDLDVEKLDRILHENLEDEGLRVSRDDIALALGGSQSRGYVDWFVDVTTHNRMPRRHILLPGMYLFEKYLEPIGEARMLEEEEGIARARSQDASKSSGD